MKTKLFILSFTICGLTSGQSWQWAYSAGFQNYERGSGIAVDNAGNIYASGVFSDSIRFGNIKLFVTKNDTSGGDIFIAKFNPSGNVIWAKSAGGKSYDACGLTIYSNEIFLYGTYSDTAYFDNDTLIGSGYNHLLIAKYDTSGNLIWIYGSKGNPLDGVSRICFDKSGNIFLTGSYNDTLIFGNDTLIETNAFPNSNIYVAKMNQNGLPLWIKEFSSQYGINGNSIIFDKNDKLYLAGFFQGTANFDSFVFNSNPVFTNDFYLLNMDSLGNVLWVNQGNSSLYAGISSLSIDSSNNIYAFGNYRDTLIFISDTIISSGVFEDLFIAKYTSSGNFIWAKTFGSGDADKIGGLIHNEKLFIAGSFKGVSLQFGNNISVTNTQLGNYELFLAEYDTSGLPIWAKSAGGTDDEHGGITAYMNDIYMVGQFKGTTGTFFDNIDIYGNNSTMWDFFIAKLSNNTAINNLQLQYLGIKISPNPFSTQTTLRTDMFLKKASLTVYNSIGQTVKQIDNLSGQTIVFQRDNLSSGLYFVRLTEDNTTVAADKLVIADK